MRTYRCTGYIGIESTGDEAEYDFDLEWDDDSEPTEMDILRAMLDTGDIQIVPADTELIEDDE